MRKVVIVVLTLAALATAIIGVGTKLAIRYSNEDFFYTTMPIPLTTLSIEFSCLDRHFSPYVGMMQRFQAPKGGRPPSWKWKLWDSSFVVGSFTRGGTPIYPEHGEKIIVWFRGVFFQLWFLAIVFVAYSAFTFIRGPLRRWCRRGRGLCLKCGYNLAGNESGTCPECGKSV